MQLEKSIWTSGGRFLVCEPRRCIVTAVNRSEHLTGRFVEATPLPCLAYGSTILSCHWRYIFLRSQPTRTATSTVSASTIVLGIINANNASMNCILAVEARPGHAGGTNGIFG